VTSETATSTTNIEFHVVPQTSPLDSKVDDDEVPSPALIERLPGFVARDDTSVDGRQVGGSSPFRRRRYSPATSRRRKTR
jgi:hypothetical protein